VRENLAPPESTVPIKLPGRFPAVRVTWGFGRLVQAGRPELTIEWEILNQRWDPLFSDQHREAARWRLRQAGIEPPRWSLTARAERRHQSMPSWVWTGVSTRAAISATAAAGSLLRAVPPRRQVHRLPATTGGRRSRAG